MKRTILIITIIIGILVAIAMYLQQAAAVTGLIAAPAGALTKMVEKVQ